MKSNIVNNATFMRKVYKKIQIFMQVIVFKKIESFHVKFCLFVRQFVF